MEIFTIFDKIYILYLFVMLTNKYIDMKTKFLLFPLMVLCLVGCNEYVPINGENFSDEVFRDYVRANFDLDGDGRMSKEEFSRVKRIEISSLQTKKKITKLNCIDKFKNLIYLDCSYNNIKRLDLTGNKKIREVWCADNGMVELNISNCSDLRRVECSGNELKSLNLQGCSSLRILDCPDNDIANLDLSDCSESLSSLNCCYNCLEELSLYDFRNLEKLNCSHNQLTVLHVSGCSSLMVLYCNDNRLNNRLNLDGCNSLHYSNVHVKNNPFLYK